MTVYVILHGTPADGFGVIGTWSDMDTAIGWAEANLTDDWWLMPMDTPQVTEAERASEHAAFHARSNLAMGSSLCSRCERGTGGQQTPA